jgi:hypothetical protein
MPAAKSDDNTRSVNRAQPEHYLDCSGQAPRVFFDQQQSFVPVRVEEGEGEQQSMSAGRHAKSVDPSLFTTDWSD